MRVVTDEILEHIQEVIEEISTQLLDYEPDIFMPELTDPTNETVCLDDKIMERYTTLHQSYYEQTIGEWPE